MAAGKAGEVERARRVPGQVKGPFVDVRMRGFAERSSLQAALAWVDAAARRLAAEAVKPEEAAGRVLTGAAPVVPVEPARAVEDGYAVRAQQTVGASPYGPLLLRLQDGGAPLGGDGAALVVAGRTLPAGADAILPFAAAQARGAFLEVLAPSAVGVGVERRDEGARAVAALPPTRPLRPQDAALLATLEVGSIEVVRRPRVRVVVAGPKRRADHLSTADACGPLLKALLARDGALAEVLPPAEGRRGLAAALAAAGGPDAVLVAGRSAVGPDDDAPGALADVGELSLHGLAIRPGGSAGLGFCGGAPVVLLPGDPLGCLFAYELVAGRLVRRLGGRDPALPHVLCEAELARKVVSAIGFLEACSVRMVDGRAEPTGSPDEAGLASAVRADGFVLVPEALEGYPAGTRVAVHLYQPG